MLIKKKYKRRSIRLKDYDYSQPEAYFVTICTYNRECILGNIINGEMQINGFGKIVKNEWLKTAKIRKTIGLDEFVVMPNHIHGIIMIFDDNCRGTLQRAPTILKN